jgi:glycosyltransferase involved in cell wall biosynthesis
VSPPEHAEHRPLRIAMVGQKGLPATWGGIEHHVEQVGMRLAERGHEVTVYCRDTYGEHIPEAHLGMRLRRTSTLGTKSLDAIVHSATSSVAALAARADVVHYHAIGPGLVAPLPRYLSSAGVVLTVHGLDHARDKWGRAGRTALGTAHLMSPHVPHELVVVSRALQDHYRSRFGRETVHVPNGVTLRELPPDPDAVLDRLGLRPRGYALFVGRLVPEKRPDLLLRAFARVPTDQRLVLAGDSSFTDDYVAELTAATARDPRVVMAGFTVGDDLAALYAGSSAVVQPSSLEGLPLTLLEAIGHDAPVVASDIAPHVEVLGAGSPRHLLFPVDDEDALVAALTRVLAAPGADDLPAAQRLRQDVLARYSWDDATTRLEDVYRRVVGREAGQERRDRRRHEARGRARSVVRAARRGVRRPAERPLPQLLVVGAMRSGTTSLYTDLVRHPQVRPPLAKELHYFSLHHDRGTDWYRRCFPVLGDGELTLEATPYYLFDPLVPARVAATLPDARFVVVLRDPVERAVSHYLHTRRTGDEPLELAEALAAEPERLASVADATAGRRHEVSRQYSYLARSRYGEQLERWFAHVDRDRVLVLRTEELADRPQDQLDRVHAHVGLPAWRADGHTRHTRRREGAGPAVPDDLVARLRAELDPDVARLTSLLGWDRGWW